jgi:glycosyltransferase involved in cell wall biosynthesis
VEQTSKEIQAIIVDDGSKNNAGKLCDEYAERFPIIKVLHIENQGVSNARNVGIKEASGEYLMFLDADDWLDVNLCSNLLNNLKNNEPDLLIFNYSKVIQDKIIPSPVHLTDYTFKEMELKELQLIILRYSKQFQGINLCTPWCKLYKTDMIRQSGVEFINGLKRAEDMLFNLEVLEYAKDVRFYSTMGYFYRINDSSESQTFTPTIKELSSQIHRYLEDFLITQKKENLFYEAFHAYCIENIFEQLYMYYGHDKSTLKEFYEVLEKEPFLTAHKKVKLDRLRYAKLQIYTLVTRLYLRKLLIFCIYYKNKTELRGKFFRY